MRSTHLAASAEGLATHLEFRNRKHSLKSVILAAVLAAAALASYSDPSIAQVRWQMATEYPETNISGVGLATFGRLVSDRTHGFVTTVNAFDNELKISSGDMLDAAQHQRIIGGDAFAGPLEATDAIFGLSSLPFVVQSVEAAKAVNLRARGLYEKALKARGLKLLYITIWPATGLWSDRPINNADDLRMLNIRTYDYNSADVMRAAGARAEYLPFNEAVARVKQHRLNAILSSGDGGAGRKLWNYLGYFTAINYAIPISIAFIRADAFDSLPKEVQGQVEQAATEAEHQQISNLSDRIVANYNQMRANGVVIAEPASPEVAAALRAASQQPIAAWKAKAGSEAAEIAESALQR